MANLSRRAFLAGTAATLWATRTAGAHHRPRHKDTTSSAKVAWVELTVPETTTPPPTETGLVRHVTPWFGSGLVHFSPVDGATAYEATATEAQ